MDDVISSALECDDVPSDFAPAPCDIHADTQSNRRDAYDTATSTTNISDPSTRKLSGRRRSENYSAYVNGYVYSDPYRCEWATGRSYLQPPL